MAKVKIKGVKELSKRLERNINTQLKKLFRDKELRKRIGELVVADIKKNVDFGSSDSEWVKYRDKIASKNSTDPAYKQGSIKAVFTSELLQDLINSIKGDTLNFQFVIEHSEKRHKKYQGVTKKIGSRSKYTEISKGLVRDMGYDYFQLSAKAQKEITKIIREEIFELLG